MKQDETRQKLIDGTIYVIAKDGLDKASTKQISHATSVNEAYIYRCFKDKEDLFAKTFSYLDEKLITKIMKHVPVVKMSEIEYQTRVRLIFTPVWKYLLENRDECITFIRYYYSPYFSKYSAEEHKKRFEPFINDVKDGFNEESNVWMIFNHIITTMLDFAVKVFEGEIPDNDDTEEHVFRLIYVSSQQYFKP